jgi:SHAQKYF class myb-like DNA-binding protein
MNIDPSTPGKVVDTGREQTGRWTKEEHEAFLSALQLYGKEWKKVAAKVKTRTVVQTRTHAQKYFQKLQKSQDSPSGDESPQMVGDAGGGSHRKKNRRSSSATISAAQVISGLSAARGGGGGASMLPPPPAMSSVGVSGGGAHSVSFVTAGSSHTSSGQMLGSIKPASSRHGFSSSSFIKITAPDPTLILKTVGFPEPSPAATGKRKLAEIAAARMLAGVAGGSSGRSSGGFSRQDEDDDGPPTPPPPPAAPLSASTASSSGAVAGGVLLSLKGGPPPPPPLALDRGPNSVNPPKGLSLQIVNPDSLGVSFGARARSGNSPVTPWDGQLEALVSSGSTAPALDDDARSTAAACATEPSARPSSVHAAALPSHGYGRSPLHAAVCENNVDFARELLSQQRSALNTDDFFQYIHQPDELGYASLHSACALLLLMESKSADSDEEPASALEIVSVLLQAGADVGQLDRRDNTPLHWAARAGDYQVVEKLLLRANLDARNVDGETPLHWALRAGRRGRNVVAVLLESGARPNVLNNSFKRPIDVAVEGFLDDPKSFFSLKASFDAGKKIKKDLVRFRKEIRTERRESRSNLLIRSPHSRTLVLHHPECLEHHPKSATDWETPDRIVSIMRRVLPHSDATGATETSGVFPHEISVSQEFERAKLDLLRRVHSTEYLSFVNQLSKDLERQLKENGTSVEDDDAVSSPPPVVPFTPLVQRSMIKIDDASVKCGLSSDTSFSAGSLKAARRAAGAVQHAVDWYVQGSRLNAGSALQIAAL